MSTLERKERKQRTTGYERVNLAKLLSSAKKETLKKSRFFPESNIVFMYEAKT